MVWLRKHNPYIDWKEKTLEFISCEHDAQGMCQAQEEDDLSMKKVEAN